MNHAVVPCVFAVCAVDVCENLKKGINEQNHCRSHFNYICAYVGALFGGFACKYGNEHYDADSRDYSVQRYEEGSKVISSRACKRYFERTRKRFPGDIARDAERRAERLGYCHKEQSVAVIEGEEQPEQKANERYAVRYYR